MFAEDGWLTNVTQVPSPNCDARPDEQDISLIVIHGISLPPGEFGGPWIDALFCNELDSSQHIYFQEICELRVSSHFLIRRDGSVTQFVPVNQRAWHAGESCFQGRTCCNDFSIGIELEGEDNTEYTADQYDSLAFLVEQLLQTYPLLSEHNIVGHSDIAPGRKTDPGPAFDWAHFRKKLQQRLASSA